MQILKVLINWNNLNYLPGQRRRIVDIAMRIVEIQQTVLIKLQVRVINIVEFLGSMTSVCAGIKNDLQEHPKWQ
jgi:hypothetical protein